MALDSRLHLSNDKFIQTTGETLTLSGDTNVEGSLTIAAGSTFSATTINTDSVQFEDGDTYIHEVADDNLEFVISSNGRWRMVGNNFQGVNTNAPYVLNENASNTNPTFAPNRADASSGIGGNTGEVSLITGGVEAINIDGSQNTTINGNLTVTGTTNLSGNTTLGLHLQLGNAQQIRLDDDGDSYIGSFSDDTISMYLGTSLSYVFNTNGFNPSGGRNLGAPGTRWTNLYATNIVTGTATGDTVNISAWETDASQFRAFATLTAGDNPTFEIFNPTQGQTTITAQDITAEGNMYVSGTTDIIGDTTIFGNIISSNNVGTNTPNIYLDEFSTTGIRVAGGTVDLIRGNNTITTLATDGLVIGNNNDLYIGSDTGHTSDIRFGDGDTRIREIADDELTIQLNGSAAWKFEEFSFEGNGANQPAIRAEQSSSTNPVFLPFKGTTITGLGGASGEVSLIIAGVESLTVDNSRNTTIYGDLVVTGNTIISSANTLTLDGGTGDWSIGYDGIGGGQIDYTVGGAVEYTMSTAAFGINGNAISQVGPIEFNDGGLLRTTTTSGHSYSFTAYDTDNTQYRTFATLTAGDTPTFEIFNPAGGQTTITTTSLTFENQGAGANPSLSSNAAASADLILNGDLRGGFSTASFRLENIASTTTTPVFVPNGNNTTTGIGGDGGGVSIINGGSESLRVDTNQDVEIFNGSLTLPSGTTNGLKFDNGDTEIYQAGTNELMYFRVGGTQKIVMGATTNINGNIIQEGSSSTVLRAETSGGFYMSQGATVVYSFLNDQDTGLDRNSEDNISLVTGGVDAIRIDSGQTTTINGDLFISGKTTVQSGVEPTGGYYFGDGDSGFFESSDDDIRVDIASAARWRFLSASFGGINTGEPTIGRTTNSYGWIDDSGTHISWGGNDTIHVQTNGQTGLTVNASQEVIIQSGLTLATQPTSGSSDQALIRNTTTGAIEYKNLSSLGGGDVSKVGTPVDNQVAVWTGDGTIEGDTGFTYNGSQLDIKKPVNITGDTNVSGAILSDGSNIGTNTGSLNLVTSTSTTKLTLPGASNSAATLQQVDAFNVALTSILVSGSDDYGIRIGQTLNDGGGTGTYRGLKIDITETNSAGWTNSYVMDALVDSSSVFNVDLSGNTSIYGNLFIASATTTPSTPSSGGTLFVSGNSIYFKDTTGTDTDLTQGGGATDLNSLTDVTITSVDTGHTLYYDGSNWANNSEFTITKTANNRTNVRLENDGAFGTGLQVVATSGTSTASASILVQTDNNGGDAYINFDALRSYALGIDADDNESFKFNAGSTPSTPDTVWRMGPLNTDRFSIYKPVEIVEEFTNSLTNNVGLEIASTLNATGAGGSDTFTGLRMDVTETDSSGWDNLHMIDVYTNGNRIFNMDFSGNTSMYGNLFIASATTTPATPSSGGTLFVSGNSIYFKDTTGTNTNLTTAGSGDVTKVGTPVDNQVAVWTGDGTIEGDTGFTYNGSQLDIKKPVNITGDTNIVGETVSNDFAVPSNGDFRFNGAGGNTYISYASGTGTMNFFRSGSVYYSATGSIHRWTSANVAGNTDDAFRFQSFTLSDDNVEQRGLRLQGTINQTSTASYVGLLVDLTETGTGSGIKRMFETRKDNNPVFYVTNDGATFMASATTQPDTPSSGGTLFVSGNSIYFKDTTGTDTDLTQGGGSGDVTKVGTPIDNQVAVWTGDGTIEGDTGFTYNGSQLDIRKPVNITGNTTITGDGEFTGLLQSGTFFSQDANSFRLVSVTPSTSQPTYNWRNDTNTGVGKINSGRSDEFILIAGATEGLRVKKATTSVNIGLNNGTFGLLDDPYAGGDGVFHINEVTTAPTGGSASGGILYVSGTSLNYVDTGGTNTNLTLAATETKAITIENPTATENITMFYTDAAITITKVADVIVGANSVTWNIDHDTVRTGGTPNSLFSADRVTSNPSGSTTTTFNDATVPADSWIWFTSSAISGTPTQLNVTLKYTVD